MNIITEPTALVSLESQGELVEVPATLEQWKAKAEALWAIIDDIDTYGDMFKPTHTPYFIAVNKKQRQRFNHMYSNGYDIINVVETSGDLT